MAYDDACHGMGTEREEMVVRALTAPATADELVGEAAAALAFRAAVAARPHRRLGLRLVTGTGVGAVTVAGVLSAGVMTAAAYTAHLPDPVQRVAHHLLHHVGVPAPRSDRHVVRTPAPAPRSVWHEPAAHPASVRIHRPERTTVVIRREPRSGASLLTPNASPKPTAWPTPNASPKPTGSPSPSPSATPKPVPSTSASPKV